MSETTAVSTDVALMGLRKRMELADQIEAASEENTPLRGFAVRLREHCRIAIEHLETGSTTTTVGSEAGFVALLSRQVDSASFVILGDLCTLLTGSRLPERSHG